MSPGTARARFCTTGPAEVATAQHDALVAEAIGDQGVQVPAVGRDVVEPVGRDLAVAEAAEVRHDDLEAGGGQRLDTRHQIRFDSGQPCTRSSGTPPGPSWT